MPQQVVLYLLQLYTFSYFFSLSDFLKIFFIQSNFPFFSPVFFDSFFLPQLEFACFLLDPFSIGLIVKFGLTFLVPSATILSPLFSPSKISTKPKYLSPIVTFVLITLFFSSTL